MGVVVGTFILKNKSRLTAEVFFSQLRAGNMADDATRRAVSEIPLLKTNSGPRDKELWVQRLKEEYLALIKVNIEAPSPNRAGVVLFSYSYQGESKLGDRG